MGPEREAESQATPQVHKEQRTEAISELRRKRVQEARHFSLGTHLSLSWTHQPVSSPRKPSSTADEYAWLFTGCLSQGSAVGNELCGEGRDCQRKLIDGSQLGEPSCSRRWGLAR